MADLPQFEEAALVGHREMIAQLHQWAPTVHDFVKERIAAMAALHPRDRGMEPIAEYIARVRLHGQRPFPEGECLYDEDNGNTNRAYEHIEIGYGLSLTDDGPTKITFSGWYPKWNEDGSDYQTWMARVFCPSWLVTDPDGIDRYRARTAELVAEFAADLAREAAELDAILGRVLADRAAAVSAPGEGAQP